MRSWAASRGLMGGSFDEMKLVWMDYEGRLVRLLPYTLKCRPRTKIALHYITNMDDKLKSTALNPANASETRDILLMMLRDGVCRWTTTINESGEQLFCGASCDPLPNVYCKEHQSLARAKPMVRAGS